jgi:hypothetical protein
MLLDRFHPLSIKTLPTSVHIRALKQKQYTFLGPPIPVQSPADFKWISANNLYDACVFANSGHM